MVITNPDKLAVIRRLNDMFRTTLQGGNVFLTRGVANLSPMVVSAALQRVSEFNDWTSDIDPHGEHDFLSFDLANRKFCFVIQYFDLEMKNASIDPADPRITKRVATLMLIHEW